MRKLKIPDRCSHQGPCLQKIDGRSELPQEAWWSWDSQRHLKTPQWLLNEPQSQAPGPTKRPNEISTHRQYDKGMDSVHY